MPIDNRLNAEEIESRAWIEANRHFPDLIGEIYLEFYIQPSSTGKANETELVLIACRKEHIKPYLETLQAAGLTVKIIDVNCYALERALPLVTDISSSIKTIAILNLNINLSSLVVVHKK